MNLKPSRTVFALAFIAAVAAAQVTFGASTTLPWSMLRGPAVLTLLASTTGGSLSDVVIVGATLAMVNGKPTLTVTPAPPPVVPASKVRRFEVLLPSSVRNWNGSITSITMPVDMLNDAEVSLSVDGLNYANGLDYTTDPNARVFMLLPKDGNKVGLDVVIKADYNLNK